MKTVKFSVYGHYQIKGLGPIYCTRTPGDNSGEYVSLSDYEALQAKNDKLIAVLQKTTRLLDGVDIDDMELIAYVCLLREPVLEKE